MAKYYKINGETKKILEAAIEEEGEFYYHCSFNSSMKGLIIVN
jgi:plastocyanin